MPGPTDAATDALESSDRRRVRHTGRNVLLSLVAVVLVAGVLAGGYLWNLAQTFNSASQKIETAFPDEASRPEKSQTAPGQNVPLNILVMGSDSRGATEMDAVEGTATDQRADTLMLINIPADRKNVTAMSIMRDLWVTIPGSGEAKINAALAQGGVPRMVETVEFLFNQRIDHVAMVNFEGFKALTDALGGVEVNVTVPFTSTHGDFEFTAGPTTMNGEQALGFVRERYAFTDGDYQRVRNQQSYVKALLGTLISAQTLTNPVTINNVVSSAAPYISVDSGLDAAALGSLGLELSGIREKDIAMFTLPTLGTGTSADGQSIVLKDPAAIDNISAALADDAMAGYVAANNFQNGN
ncbi:LCP family protein [Pseudarthrobacter sp. PS3-L1]|uniref:LCP family protein n=1 Tax=Pseudarthrobacter sp. PS3-L1 TaxID=3046207 RepID=UPI0024BBC1BB|nr:LCP family protein [Pseudarthrobacter sp. PS3-L1]MDJ0321151.1 LCP family protein [Pseudarthrobacter sp. PS3-L1]